ncbi:hypothetical protein HK096_005971 [Nowakowskiella sp. JEL0078]|nr:hypothetical protein HK096_005971 [Nowakowskiella sp. JEL0078]
MKNQLSGISPKLTIVDRAIGLHRTRRPSKLSQTFVFPDSTKLISETNDPPVDPTTSKSLNLKQQNLKKSILPKKCNSRRPSVPLLKQPRKSIQKCSSETELPHCSSISINTASVISSDESLAESKLTLLKSGSSSYLTPASHSSAPNLWTHRRVSSEFHLVRTESEESKVGCVKKWGDERMQSTKFGSQISDGPNFLRVVNDTEKTKSGASLKEDSLSPRISWWGIQKHGSKLPGLLKSIKNVFSASASPIVSPPIQINSSGSLSNLKSNQNQDISESYENRNTSDLTFEKNEVVSTPPSMISPDLDSLKSAENFAPLQSVICRICEDHIRASDLDDHSKICVIQQELHIKIEMCDSLLRKLSAGLIFRCDRLKSEDFKEADFQLLKRLGLNLERKALKAVQISEENERKGILDCERYLFKVKTYLDREEPRLSNQEPSLFSYGRKVETCLGDKIEAMKKLSSLNRENPIFQNRHLLSDSHEINLSSVSSTISSSPKSRHFIATKGIKKSESCESCSISSDGQSSFSQIKQKESGGKLISLFAALLKGSGHKRTSSNVSTSLNSIDQTDMRLKKQKTVSIRDFEIIKPISRGAFGTEAKCILPEREQPKTCLR